MIKASEYIERRNKVIEKMKNNSAMVLFAGCEMKASADSTHEFVVNTNFFYLTGIKQKNSILVIFKHNNRKSRVVLLIDPIDEFKVKWTGRMLSVDEARALSGINDVITFGEESFENNPELLKIGNLNKFKKIYFDLEDHLFINMDLTTTMFAKQFSDAKIKVENAFPLLIELRMVKSPAEIEEIKASIHTTNLGLQAILKNLEPNKYEYQMASLFEYTIRDHNYSGLSFPTIAASGKNAVILHYPTPTEKLHDNELLLLDLGAEKDMYRADISRTYPINGKFTDRQKEVYEMVLRCNKAVQEYMKPGVTLYQCQQFTFDFLKAELLEHGYINEAKAREDAEIRAKEIATPTAPISPAEFQELVRHFINEQVLKYYCHSVSHHLGLDVHDQSERNAKLVPGMVVTDEPGLYMEEYGIGIRIEDDILITEDGSVCLSEEIIKEVKDIEKYMKK